ncbi:hypothetical protein [Methylocystis echinoides]|jgi:hypothetical protein|uniref:hypothetical protein n=1 Tax=Methylocystis echinoides TaxID=29468 RepID=UPI003446F30B
MKKLILLAGCAAAAMTTVEADAKPSPAVAVSVVLSRPTPAARKAEIGRQVALMCNLSLSADELNRASAFIEANRARGVHWVADQISRSELSYACGD